MSGGIGNSRAVAKAAAMPFPTVRVVDDDQTVSHDDQEER
jgi:hypothetical protein